MSRRGRLVLCLAVALVGGVCVWAAFLRSLIPHGLDGTVTGLTYVSATTGRARQIQLGDEFVEVDAPVEEIVQVGSHVSKRPWEPTLHVDNRDVPLQAGPEVLQLALLTPVACGVAWLASRPAVRRSGEGESAGRGG